MIPTQTKVVFSAAVFLVLLLLVWAVFVPPYNVPKFEAIENNQTGFLIPLDQDTSAQAHFESAAYLKDKKVAAKRVQIHRRWVQRGWLYTHGEYLDTERLIVVDRSPVIREWTNETTTGTSTKDESMVAQSMDGTGLKLNFTCTAYIPESDEEHPEGAEHFLYYYKGESLGHVMDNEVRARIQAVAAEFTAQYPLETLRGTQHKLAEAVRQDVVPFFKKRGIAITNVGLVGGFHYVNKDIQRSIDDAIQAQQLKIVAMAKQEQEKVQQQTKLNNQKIENETIKLRAEGEALARLAGAKIDAEAAKIQAEGKAAAVKITADAEAYKYKLIDQYRELALALRTLDVEQAWRSLWQGSVPQTILSGMSGQTMPIFPLPSLTTPKLNQEIGGHAPQARNGTVPQDK